MDITVKVAFLAAAFISVLVLVALAISESPNASWKMEYEALKIIAARRRARSLRVRTAIRRKRLKRYGVRVITKDI